LAQKPKLFFRNVYQLDLMFNDAFWEASFLKAKQKKTTLTMLKVWRKFKSWRTKTALQEKKVFVS